MRFFDVFRWYRKRYFIILFRWIPTILRAQRQKSISTKISWKEGTTRTIISGHPRENVPETKARIHDGQVSWTKVTLMSYKFWNVSLSPPILKFYAERRRPEAVTARVKSGDLDLLPTPPIPTAIKAVVRRGVLKATNPRPHAKTRLAIYPKITINPTSRDRSGDERLCGPGSRRGIRRSRRFRKGSVSSRPRRDRASRRPRGTAAPKKTAVRLNRLNRGTRRAATVIVFFFFFTRFELLLHVASWPPPCYEY